MSEYCSSSKAWCESAALTVCGAALSCTWPMKRVLVLSRDHVEWMSRSTPSEPDVNLDSSTSSSSLTLLSRLDTWTHTRKVEIIRIESHGMWRGEGRMRGGGTLARMPRLWRW